MNVHNRSRKDKCYKRIDEKGTPEAWEIGPFIDQDPRIKPSLFPPTPLSKSRGHIDASANPGNPGGVQFGSLFLSERLVMVAPLMTKKAFPSRIRPYRYQ